MQNMDEWIVGSLDEYDIDTYNAMELQSRIGDPSLTDSIEDSSEGVQGTDGMNLATATIESLSSGDDGVGGG